MDTPLFSGHLGAFANAISKNLPSSDTKWLPITVKPVATVTFV